jgi:hypothetical protein
MSDPFKMEEEEPIQCDWNEIPGPLKIVDTTTDPKVLVDFQIGGKSVHQIYQEKHAPSVSITEPGGLEKFLGRQLQPYEKGILELVTGKRVPLPSPIPLPPLSEEYRKAEEKWVEKNRLKPSPDYVQSNHGGVSVTFTPDELGLKTPKIHHSTLKKRDKTTINCRLKRENAEWLRSVAPKGPGGASEIGSVLDGIVERARKSGGAS